MFSQTVHKVDECLDYSKLPQLSSFSFVFGQLSSTSREDCLRYSVRRLVSLPFGRAIFSLSTSDSSFHALHLNLITLPDSIEELQDHVKNYLSFTSTLSHYLSIISSPHSPSFSISTSTKNSQPFFPRAKVLSRLPQDPSAAGGYLFAAGLLKQLSNINYLDIKYTLSKKNLGSVGALLGVTASNIGSVLCYGLLYTNSKNFGCIAFLTDVFQQIRLFKNFSTVDGVFNPSLPSIFLSFALSLSLPFFKQPKSCPFHLKTLLYSLLDDRDPFQSIIGVIGLGLIYYRSNSLEICRVINPDLTFNQMDSFPSLAVLFVRSFSSCLISPAKSICLIEEFKSRDHIVDDFQISDYFSKCVLAQIAGTLLGCAIAFQDDETSDQSQLIEHCLQFFKIALVNFSVLPTFILNSLVLGLSLLHSGSCSTLVTSLILKYQSVSQSPDSWIISSFCLGLICAGKGKYHLNIQNNDLSLALLICLVLVSVFPVSSGIGKEHYAPIHLFCLFLIIQCFEEK
ncbi:hypothetical protein GEMRC1_003210 [Eukaryota sp. GEM-RC1]